MFTGFDLSFLFFFLERHGGPSFSIYWCLCRRRISQTMIDSTNRPLTCLANVLSSLFILIHSIINNDQPDTYDFGGYVFTLLQIWPIIIRPNAI